MEAMLEGEWREPTNSAADQKGGIHDDDTATDLGFRGGTVAGDIHMEQFPPLLVEAFGEDWWRTGSLSLYFNSATVHQEPVRCFMSEVETDGTLRRASVWMEKEDGTTIVSGTASAGGHDANSALHQRLAAIRPVSELRILADMQLGDATTAQPTHIPGARVDRQLTVITEPLECYRTADHFGGRVLPMTGIIGAFAAAESILAESAKPPFVGLYGAIEIEFIKGPVLADTDYLAEGKIVGLSESPKTEVLWREMTLTRDREPIARMLKMDRIMKDSSPLWSSKDQ